MGEGLHSFWSRSQREVKMYNENVPYNIHSKGHFLGPWVYTQAAIEHTLKDSLSTQSKGHFLGSWAYAQSAIEHTLKDPFFICLSIRSRTHKRTLWVTFKVPKNYALSKITTNCSKQFSIFIGIVMSFTSSLTAKVLSII